MAALLAACLAQAVLAGCGNGATSVSPHQQLCDSLSELRASVNELRGLGRDSTRAEVQQSVDGLQIALENVGDSVGGVLRSNVDTIERSLDRLSAQIGSMPANAPVGDVVATVQQSIPALRTAVDQVVGGVDCSGT